MLFIVSALVPLSLCAAILYNHFSNGLQTAQQRSLDELARGYGMIVLERLKAADEAFKPIASDPSSSDVFAESQASRLPWVRSADTIVPALDARQLDVLKHGASALVSSPEGSGVPAISLLRQRPSGVILRAVLDPKWIWAETDDFAGEAVLAVRDDHRRALKSSAGAPATVPRDWTIRSWELFLGSGFASPSWTVVAMEKRPSILGDAGEVYLPIFAFIVLTILLIAWLSMTSIRRQLQPLELLIGATGRLAQRDFEAFRDLHWNDEFGDLARSFDSMSGRLQKQFAALETFSDVDRLLLDQPVLEAILDKILPQVAAILCCERVAVLLFDVDSSADAAVHEYNAFAAERLPVRYIARDAAREARSCFNSIGPDRAGRIEAHELGHGENCTGLLCLAYGNTHSDQDHGVEARDFADRLSLIIASLRRSDQLHRQAEFDSLTGLQNRQKLAGRVRDAVALAAGRGEIGCLMYIDLDHFKRVNDTSGHAAGDRLLQIVGERLLGAVDSTASVARLGGDEFAVLLPSIPNAESARRRAEKIIALLEPPITVDNRLHQISASIGIALFPYDGSTLEELMRVGDIAMYHAKERGRGKAEFYRSEMHQALLDRMRLEEGLEQAFQQRELVLHYQPIICAEDFDTFGVEALLRWPVEGGTAWIAPSAFIPVAEENGLIVEMGQWVLQSTCEQFARWRATGLNVSYASVNVSVRQLREPEYFDKLVDTLREHAMRGEELQIEITESVLAEEAELKGVLGRIAAHGVRLALDDFGTGYSSLGYLRTFPIDTVKIDRAFIMGVPQDPGASRLVDSIILMCAALGKKVVAEGIETDEQRRYLIQSGCTTLQGYLLGRPMDPADIPGFAQRLRGAFEPVAKQIQAAYG